MRKHIALIALTLIGAVGAAAELDPIAALQSASSLEEQAEACRLLSISGDAAALPLLEPLLLDEKLSHMARYALETMPTPEADAILRRALSQVTGTLKAGVVASLGVRRDAAAAPELIALLADENVFIAGAAAHALGRIATPEGVQALEGAIAQPGLPFATVLCLGDGLFFAAENALANGQAAEAARLYDVVRAVDALPDVLRTGAFRGAVLARAPEEGLVLLLEAVRGESPLLFAASLRTALEMKDKERVAAALSEALPALSEDRKIQIMQTLGELSQATAGPALLHEAAEGAVAVRVAALGAAVRLGCVETVPVLTSLLLAEDEALAKAAKDGLSYFPGETGDAAVRELLKSEDARLRLVAVELLGQGALPAPANLLMETARDDAEESVRVAALKNMREYAGAEQMSGLLAHLLVPRSPDELLAAEQVLVLLRGRGKNAGVPMPEGFINDLREGLAAGEGVVKQAAVRVLAAGGEQEAFDIVLPLALEENELQGTAVRAVCDWPTPLALSTLMGWVGAPPIDAVRAPALRGAIRLLMLGQDAPEALCERYAALMAQVASPDEKKLVLSGLAKVSHAAALSMTLDCLEDEAVRAEAVQAAIAIAKSLDASPENAEILEKAKAAIPELREEDGK